MSCEFSRELLALHAGGDLSEAAAARTDDHLASCDGCRQCFDELSAGRALLKSIRLDTASRAECAAMRREVMTRIEDRRRVLGWGVRLERAIALGFRPSYGLAALVLLGILSISVLAQMRPGGRADTMLRPDGYRGWVLVADRVYIDPSSYREYAKTRQFPDGTVLVWERPSPRAALKSDGPHQSSSTLLVSMKDSARFDGGWGFFDFSGTVAGPPSRVRALPESRGCRTCHRDGALTEIRQLTGKQA